MTGSARARRLLALCALAVALVFAVAARPAAAEDNATKTARRHFTKGNKLFALGRFEEALGHFESAYEAKPIAGFLFNIAQCHRNLGHLDEAIFSYRKYLTEQPDAENREDVEQQIDDLEEERDKRNAQILKDPPPVVRKPTGTVKKPIYARWWFWGGIAAVAGAGAGTYLLTRDGDVPSTDLGNVVFD
jgi:tetratricopeptide (TPR) repeat protein